MYSNKYLFLPLLFLGLFLGTQALAQPCPVCVVAIGAGLGFSRWLGVDDVVSSVWIGAALITAVLWTIHWFAKKNWNFKFRDAIIFAAYYILTYVPLWYVGIVGHPQNTLWGIDKIILGSAVGTAGLLLALRLNDFLRSKNNNKSYFPYQKVVMPFGVLLVLSLIISNIV